MDISRGNSSFREQVYTHIHCATFADALGTIAADGPWAITGWGKGEGRWIYQIRCRTQHPEERHKQLILLQTKTEIMITVAPAWISTLSHQDHISSVSLHRGRPCLMCFSDYSGISTISLYTETPRRNITDPQYSHKYVTLAYAYQHQEACDARNWCQCRSHHAGREKNADSSADRNSILGGKRRSKNLLPFFT